MAEKKEPEAAAVEGAEKSEKTTGRKKINRLTAAELDAKIEKLKETPGGLQSKYAQHLILRRNLLKK